MRLRYRIAIVGIVLGVGIVVAGLILYSAFQVTPKAKRARIILINIRDYLGLSSTKAYALEANRSKHTPGCLFEMSAFARLKNLRVFSAGPGNGHGDGDLFIAYQPCFDTDHRDWVALVSVAPVIQGGRAWVLWNDGTIVSVLKAGRLTTGTRALRYYRYVIHGEATEKPLFSQTRGER